MVNHLAAIVQLFQLARNARVVSCIPFRDGAERRVFSPLAKHVAAGVLALGRHFRSGRARAGVLIAWEAPLEEAGVQC